ncbi:MAG: phosphotransferase [Litorimonas sp.]
MSDNLRMSQIKDFLTAVGWGSATRKAVPGDASSRRYERLELGDHKAILMDAPKGNEPPIEPNGASVIERRALGYNALARLAGSNCEAFAAIANELTIRGFSAPKIIAADIDLGFMLLEDFGPNVYAKVVTADPDQERGLYEAASDTLAAIYRSSFPSVMRYKQHDWRVRDYDDAAMLAEMDLCHDWYAKDFNRDINTDMRAEFTALWQEAFTILQAHPRGLALRDFHAENLFWLPDRAAVSRVGLIDFQDALMTHPAYDLMSFITDIRRDVSPELKDDLISRFCAKSGLKDDADFRAAYAVLGAQRGTKLLGFPVRADLKFGKPQYRQLLPRVKHHLQDDLSHPALSKIRNWFERYIPEALS